MEEPTPSHLPSHPVEPPPAADPALRWPLRFAVLGAFGGLLAAMVLITIFTLIYTACGGSDEDGAFTFIASVLQNVAFLAVMWVLVSQLGRPRLSDFGWRRAQVGRAIGITVMLMIVYYAFLFAYGELVSLKEDTAPQELGADESTLALVAFAVLAIVMAPFVEETFFRGFLYRAISNRAGLVVGALASSLFFGLLHWDGTVDRLLAVIPLSILGIVLVLVYQYTGTLFASIGLHATNNTLAVIAFAADQESDTGIIAAAALWAVVIALCFGLPRLTDRRGSDPPPDPLAPPPYEVPPGGGALYA